MLNNKKDSRIKRMIRTAKICCFLRTYIATRTLDAYPKQSQKGLRFGILDGEQILFAKYLQQQKGFENDNEIKIMEDIKDLMKLEFLGKDKIDVNGYEQEVLRLGLKGRKLINGSFINRSVYFITYAYEDTPPLFIFLFSGGIFTVIFLITGIINTLIE